MSDTWARCRVPEECPAVVAELVELCMLDNPKERPSAKDIIDIITPFAHMTDMQSPFALDGPLPADSSEPESYDGHTGM